MTYGPSSVPPGQNPDYNPIDPTTDPEAEELMGRSVKSSSDEVSAKKAEASYQKAQEAAHVSAEAAAGAAEAHKSRKVKNETPLLHKDQIGVEALAQLGACKKKADDIFPNLEQLATAIEGQVSSATDGAVLELLERIHSIVLSFRKNFTFYKKAIASSEPLPQRLVQQKEEMESIVQGFKALEERGHRELGKEGVEVVHHAYAVLKRLHASWDECKQRYLEAREFIQSLYRNKSAHDRFTQVLSHASLSPFANKHQGMINDAGCYAWQTAHQSTCELLRNKVQGLRRKADYGHEVAAEDKVFPEEVPLLEEMLQVGSFIQHVESLEIQDPSSLLGVLLEVENALPPSWQEDCRFIQ